jgi:aminocarboxymuconate-semialdehyde decarboxylase
LRIDVHAHYWTDGYLSLLTEYGKTDTDAQRGRGAGGDAADLDARFALMDAAGVTMQVLSVSPQLPHFEDQAHAIRAAQYINDLYATVIARHPKRFAAFAALPLPHVDAALQELDRALALPGVVGVAIATSILGRSLIDPQFTPVFQELDRRGAVLYVHPSGCGAGAPLIREFHLTWMIGAPIEDTIAAVHLITAGIPSRYGRLKIINSHLGGALPMLLQRLDSQYAWEAPTTPEPPSHAARRMWYDTVAYGHVPALRCACDSFGADRLLLGTDFPYEAGAQFQRAIEYIDESGLPPSTVTKILDFNAPALLGMAKRLTEGAGADACKSSQERGEAR